MQPKAPSSGFSWFPEQASTFAGQVDALYFYLVAVTVFFTVLIAGVILIFAVRYRQKSIHDRPERMETSTALEIIWSVIPFILVVIMFFWGAEVFFEQRRTPANAMEISVTGKKWMWKFQHLNGRREINALHIPVGKPVVLRMASEDVIHDVYIPAFRTKQDVLPGRYTTLWFEATKPGVYHLFCNQYCGTQHSNMVGSVIAMEPAAYQAWLYEYSGETPEKAGEALFQKLACNSCHMAGTASRGPDLAGIIGTKVALTAGAPVTADENYIRESILNPQAKVVAGFQPIMPSFQGIVSEDQVTQLIAYIRTLKPGAGRGGEHGGVILNTSSQANQAEGLATQPNAPAPEATPEQQGAPVQGQPNQSGEQQAPQAVTPSQTPEATASATPAPSPTPEATPAPTPQPLPTPASTPESTPAPTPAPTPESTPAPSTTSTETQDQPSTNPAGSAVQ